MAEDIRTIKTSDGLYVYCTGKGPALLMIHGIISDASFFSSTAAQLSRFYEVITYDRRGYGASTEQSYTDFTVGTQAEDAAEVIRMCGGGPMIVLGNSAGGLIGLELARRYPELVKLLMMMEPSITYDDGERAKLTEWNRELNEIVKAGRLKKALPAFSRIIGDTDAPAEKVSLLEMRQTYANLENFLKGELNEVQHYYPTREEMKAIRPPMSILVTEKGRNSIFATSSASAAAALELPVYHIPGYHNTAKTQPVDFAVSLHGIIQFMS